MLTLLLSAKFTWALSLMIVFAMNYDHLLETIVLCGLDSAGKLVWAALCGL